MKALQKMRLMVARGVVNLINDAGGLQLLQVNALEGETRDDVERAQNFGMSSHPPVGSIPIMVAVAGSRDHLVAVAVDNETERPKNLKEGETKIYSSHGSSLYFDQNGDVILNCKKFIIHASDKTEVNTPEAAFSEMATVNGLFSFNNGMAGREGANGISLYGDYYLSGDLVFNGVSLKGHKHQGVLAGGDVSGLPT